jgi:hypothetical protein
MPLKWYLMLALVAAGVALVDQARRLRWTRRGFLLAWGLAAAGGLLGAQVARRLGLPELLQLRVEERPFPLIWALIGGALFVSALDAVERYRRRRARAAGA